MYKHIVLVGLGVFIFNVSITPVSAQNSSMTESAESLLKRSMGFANNSNTAVERSVLDSYAGMFVGDGSASSSVEIVSNSDYFSHLTNKKTESRTTHSYGTIRSYVNGVETSDKSYYDSTIQYQKNRKIAEYISIFPFSKTQKTETDYLDKKYKEAEFSDALRKKIMNKVIAAGNIKLNTQESKNGIYYSLDLPENPEYLIQRSMEAIPDLVLAASDTSWKIVEDKGVETLTYEYYSNPYAKKKTTKVIEARKLVLSFDIDQLSKNIVGTSKVKDLTFGFQDEQSSLADVTADMKIFYTNLLVEVWIDTKTAKLYKMYMPTYQFSFEKNGAWVQLPVEIRFEYAPTAAKSLSIPKKYITPTQIKAMYGKR